MFSLFITKNFYNFIKSGFLVDFIFKKYIYYILKFIFFYFNILISEKYLIEKFFLQSYKYYIIIHYQFNNFSKNFLLIFIGLFWFTVFFIFIFSV